MEVRSVEPPAAQRTTQGDDGRGMNTSDGVEQTEAERLAGSEPRQQRKSIAAPVGEVAGACDDVAELTPKCVPSRRIERVTVRQQDVEQEILPLVRSKERNQAQGCDVRIRLQSNPVADDLFTKIGQEGPGRKRSCARDRRQREVAERLMGDRDLFAEGRSL